MQISTDTPVSNSLDLPPISAPPDIKKSGDLDSIEFYEAAILADETRSSNYWDLGIAYLLAGREEDAQAAWFVPLSEATDADIDIYTHELATALDRAAEEQVKSTNLENAWLIRQHLWILIPDRIDNILQLIVLADALDRLTIELLLEWQIDELLENATIGSIEDNLLERTISALLQKLRSDLILKLVNSCLQLTGNIRYSIVPKLVMTAFQLFHQQNIGLFAVKLAEMCQSLTPENRDIYPTLAGLYSGTNFHVQAIASSEKFYQLATNQFEKLFGSYLIQRSYLTAGNWNGHLERLKRHRELVNSVVLDTKITENKPHQSLIVSSYFSLYLEDNPRLNRSLQNQLAAFYQNHINPLHFKSEFEQLSLVKKAGTIRIGYLASTLKEHSVGWLSRWLMHHHDRESFQIFNYCLNQNPQDIFNHRWFRDKVDISYYFNNNAQEIAAQIKADEIDILIDLDSLTFDVAVW